IGIVRVSLARKKRLDLPRRDLAPQGADGCFCLLDDRLVALFLAQLDQLDIIVKSSRKPVDRIDVFFEGLAFAHELLGLLRIVPQLTILGTRIEVIESFYRLVPVKDTSSAGLWPA